MPMIFGEGPSAFVGQPPNTERDYYIVKGFLRAAGLENVDPALGYIRAAQPPNSGYVYTSKSPGIIAGLIIIIVAITVATVSRLALRVSMTQLRFGADDWACIAAAGFGLTYTICQLQMVLRGGGNHIWDATYEDYNTFVYYGTIDKWMFYLTVGFAKLSLALFIRRLAQHISKFWRWFCDFFIFTLVVYIGLAVFWDVLSCTPIRSQWDRLYSGQLEEPGACYYGGIQGKFFNITHVVQGVMLLTSPVIILWRVRMDRAKKTRLFIIWASGTVAVLCGLMRLVRADFTSDLTWDYAELLIWTSLDVAIGIITISLPVLDAWLAGAWRDAVGRIGGGGRSRASDERHNGNSYDNISDSSCSKSGSGRLYGHGTIIKTGRDEGDETTIGTPSVSRQKHKYSESVEEILQPGHEDLGDIGGEGGKPMEMRIFTKHEFNVRYSAASPSLMEEGESRPVRGYDKRFVTGLEDNH
ncbi:hypothetical protein PG999_005711 [Apiospora kogelbergensis]|uniref:Rhodopsin domain-containing protein n=1 Tax=Apiospora kogelbergensis TaxID=1337665 RepID=A0AAW0QPI9_9PEZI